MSSFWAIAGWPLVTIGGGLLVYFVLLRPAMQKTAVALGKPEQYAEAKGFGEKALIWLDGKKTLICAVLIGAISTGQEIISHLDPETISALKTLPWADVLGQATASQIIAWLSIAASVFTVLGKLSAAKTPPQA